MFCERIGNSFMSLCGLFKRVMSEYQNVYENAKKTGKHTDQIKGIIENDIKKIIKNYVTDDKYIVEASAGSGRFTKVPWVAVLNERITVSVKRGVYIAYLFNIDKKELYLTLIQGVTSVSKIDSNTGKILSIFKDNSKSKEVKSALKSNADYIRKKLGNSIFEKNSIKTGSDNYDAGCIYYKKYTLDTLPDDAELKNNLSDFIKIYEEYYKKVFIIQEQDIQYEVLNNDTSNNLIIKEDNRMTVEKRIEGIKSYISSKGFSYDNSLIENFYLCLKTKPFVILAGTSGTGKTKLVRLFAKAIGANYKLVSVRPDWSDSSDLFGHVDLNGKFNEGIILSYIKDAENNPEKPYFICLDEMNLARVEYYLSDILSVIETREKNNDGRIITDSLVPDEIFGTDELKRKKYGAIHIPENLYIVGTVNMDETTFPFSKKVLDRANTIEFSYVDLKPGFEEKEVDVPNMIVDNGFLKTEYLVLKCDCIKEKETVEIICNKLQKINEILKEADLHIGYRVRDEIVFYMLNNKSTELLTEKEAFDNEIMQKILPRIQGGSIAVRNMLINLFKNLVEDFRVSADGKSIYEQMQAFIEEKETEISYPKSAEKIIYMIRRYEEDGFTSYWI